MDEFDSACQTHDECYAEAERDFGCGKFWSYMTSYEWHGDLRNNTISCDSTEACQLKLCQCDRQVVMALEVCITHGSSVT